MPKVNMRKALAVFLLLIPLAAFGQYISYWFQGWQRQGDAADAQAYFMRPGTNIVFTYASNRVYINASGTITNIASSTNSVYAQYATNWLGSNSMWASVTNLVSTTSNGLSGAYVLKAGDTMSGPLNIQGATFSYDVPNTKAKVTVGADEVLSLDSTFANGSVFFGYNNLGLPRENAGSVSIGDNSYALDYGVALGYLSIAWTNAVAIGGSTTANDDSVAIGNGLTSGIFGISIGRNSAVGDYGIGIGNSINAPTAYSISIGENADSGGLNASSIAIGPLAKAQYDYSMALGTNAQINAVGAVEIGEGTANVPWALHYRGVPLVNSNGVLLVTAPTVGVTATQFITDFMLGQITNVYSNGLLVATGLYVVPITPLLGAGGDAMLGAGGDSMTGAGG